MCIVYRQDLGVEGSRRGYWFFLKAWGNRVGKVEKIYFKERVIFRILAVGTKGYQIKIHCLTFMDF